MQNELEKISEILKGDSIIEKLNKGETLTLKESRPSAVDKKYYTRKF